MSVPSQVPDLQLNTSAAMPQIGFGLWRNTDREECIGSIKLALEAGFRHFDGAQAYGNEDLLGEALAASTVPRSELFVTTKIWNANQPESKLRPSFERSLEQLGLDYVDLLLLHFPVSETRREAWPIMESIYASGTARAVGVSNYTVSHLEELLANCAVRPAVNQVELSVVLQQTALVDYCQAEGVVVQAYTPLAEGHFFTDPTLAAIAEKHGRSVTQIMLRWCIERGVVALTKSVRRERINENIAIFDFALDDDDMARLAELDQGFRTNWDPTDVP